MLKREKKAMKSRDLEETGNRMSNWLSRPGGRTVVNPFNYKVSGSVYPSEYNGGNELALHVGYLKPEVPASQHGIEHRELLMIGIEREGRNSNQVASAISMDEQAWQVGKGADSAFSKGKIRIGVNPSAADYWSSCSIVLEMDLERQPVIQFKIPECESAWSIKVSDEETVKLKDCLDIYTENSGTGAFAGNIAAATGWRGRRRIRLHLFAYGYGKSIAFEQLELCHLDEATWSGAESFHTLWSPHELSFEAEYRGGLRAEGRDFLYDNNIVCRTINLRGSKTEEEGLTIGGKFNGTLRQASMDGTSFPVFIVENGNHAYAFSVLENGENVVKYYSTYANFVYDLNESDDPDPSGGYWKRTLNAGRADVLFAFKGPGEKTEDLVRRLEQATEQKIDDSLRDLESFWDQYLTRVPELSSYSLTTVDSLNVNAEQIRKRYYAAWVFLAANMLCESPETGYSYLQFCCGKPSLWGAGAEEAAYSAAWESFFAMQYYALIDPAPAWSAFKGLMSLVQPSGMLGGESLPSRKAQTALILYSITKDKSDLEEVYPQLTTYLNWRIDNPRWILGRINDPNSKDAEFVVSALADIRHMQTIADILGQDSEVKQWKERYEALYDNYKKWFWKMPGGFPHQYYDMQTETRVAGRTSWVLTGIYLDGIEEPYLGSLINRFNVEYDESQPFAGFSWPKHPDISFDIHGFLDKGFPNEARRMIEICIRDVTRSGMFAEQYDEIVEPFPTGVRPSIFGSVQLIECLMLLNGIRIDKGVAEEDKLKLNVSPIEG